MTPNLFQVSADDRHQSQKYPVTFKNSPDYNAPIYSTEYHIHLLILKTTYEVPAGGSMPGCIVISRNPLNFGSGGGSTTAYVTIG